MGVRTLFGRLIVEQATADIEVPTRGQVQSLIDTGLGGKSAVGHTHPEITGDKVDIIRTTEQAFTTEVLENETDLIVPIAANKTMRAYWRLLLEGDSAGDFGVAVVVPAGATVYGFSTGTTSGAGGPSGNAPNFAINGSGQRYSFATFGQGLSNWSVVRIEVTVQNGGTAGSIQLQGARASTTTNPTKIMPGSEVYAQERVA